MRCALPGVPSGCAFKADRTSLRLLLALTKAKGLTPHMNRSPTHRNGPAIDINGVAIHMNRQPNQANRGTIDINRPTIDANGLLVHINQNEIGL